MIRFSLKTKSSTVFFFFFTTSLSGRIFHFPFLKTFLNNVKTQQENQMMKCCKYLHAKKLRKPHLILCAPYYQCQQFSFIKVLGGGMFAKRFLIALKWELLQVASSQSGISFNWLKNKKQKKLS